MLSEFILAVAARESVAERIWHPSIQGHWLGGRVLVGGEEPPAMSYVLCVCAIISCRKCMGCVEGLQLHLTAVLQETQGSQAF